MELGECLGRRGGVGGVSRKGVVKESFVARGRHVKSITGFH